MMESGYFNNGNFRQYSYFAGGFCSLKTGIPGGPAHMVPLGGDCVLTVSLHPVVDSPI